MAQSQSVQGKYWLLTIPQPSFMPFLPQGVVYIKGQLEIGSDTGYKHWQILCCLQKKGRLAAVKKIFGEGVHAELGRSEAASEYVWKEETRVQGTQFELGELPFKRNSKTDWEQVKRKAKEGRLDEIDGDIYVRYYGNLKRIAKDNMSKPNDLDDVCGIWIYGPPGVGKSRKARSDFPESYYKMCNKWWDGYLNEKSVIIDDLDKNHKVLGHHLKIWTDRYSFIAEAKGGAMHIRPEKIIVTSNYRIEEIFDDEMLVEALSRRFNVIHCPINLF